MIAYSPPTPKVIGSARKLRNVTCTRASPAAPTIHSTPRHSVATAIAAARAGRTSTAISDATSNSEISVARGPSCSTERSIAPKTIGVPDVSIVLPSGSGRRSSTRAIASRSCPSHIETFFSA